MASAELQQELIGNYINTSANGKSHVDSRAVRLLSHMSALVLFLYDSIVTLCEEIDIIWRRKWTAMTWLFAFTRYVAIVDIILTFTSPGGAQVCAALLFTGDALLLLQYLCLASFSALRVHALLDGRYITAGVVLLLNLIPFAVNMFAFITDTTILDPEVCTEVYSGSASRGLLLSLLSRVSVIVGDVIVLAVTWAKTAQLYREARRLNIEAPLARMLICDGTLYFIILLMINVLDALGENVPILFNLGAVVSFFNMYVPPLACMISISYDTSTVCHPSLYAASFSTCARWSPLVVPARCLATSLRAFDLLETWDSRYSSAQPKKKKRMNSKETIILLKPTQILFLEAQARPKNVARLTRLKLWMSGFTRACSR
ncbi:hypothetical protein BC629DRAFT_1533929 [Irpex lacteus]|nr:hypothetical protein BC629DRAFT_1533929 [Irpex lacteus]